MRKILLLTATLIVMGVTAQFVGVPEKLLRTSTSQKPGGLSPESEGGTQHAGWTDDIGDVSQGFIDLYIGSLFAEDLTSDLEIAVNVAGLFPKDNVDVEFAILFDSDDKRTTGETFGSFSGIDKIVAIALMGRFPFTGIDGTLTAELLDVASNTSILLTPGNVKRIQKIIDSGPPTVPSSTLDHLDSIHQTVPLPELGLSARLVPIVVRATNNDTAELDEVSFLFEIENTLPN